jgi:hypothetical protein
VSRVEKHNPLKSGVIAQKRAALKEETSGRMTAIKELTFDTVRKDAKHTDYGNPLIKCRKRKDTWLRELAREHTSFWE